MFTTTLSPGWWQPGHTFFPESDPRRFRIVAIGELENPNLEHVHGVWIVEPVR